MVRRYVFGFGLNIARFEKENRFKQCVKEIVHSTNGLVFEYYALRNI